MTEASNELSQEAQHVSPGSTEGRLVELGMVPVVALDRSEDAVPLAHALLAGGVDIIEVTLRTEAALDAISAIGAALPDMTVGAGTVITTGELDQAREAGADFVVSPGVSPVVIDHAIATAIPIWPGVATPTEVITALTHGITTMKFFPADVLGGIDAINALWSVFRHLGVRFVPTGGIGAHNAPDYWRSDAVVAVGGTWLAPRGLINEQRWGRISDLCRVARQLRNEALDHLD